MYQIENKFIESELIPDKHFLFEPPPKFTVSSWADEFRILSNESSSQPGKWNTSVAEYQRGMMDAVSNPLTSQITLMTSAQVGKTEIINNIIGYYICYDPRPIFVVHPTLEMSASWSKDRLEPMIRDTDVLYKLFDEKNKSKDKSNTILHKKFPGGHVTVAGANSPSSLASRPISILLLDEVDRFPPSAGNEGDPVKLAIKRTTTFYNRKIIMVSTPTVKGASRIEQSFEESSQNYFHVPCTFCGAFQILKWKNIIFKKENIKDVTYQCEHCNQQIKSRDKSKIVLKGEWRSEHPEQIKHQGFHINELYSTWIDWSETVENFLESKKRIETLRVWINTSLGESFEEAETNTVSDVKLASRVEDYNLIPEGVALLTAGVDIQDDRICVLVKGWSAQDESYFIDYKIIAGTPAKNETWQELDKLLSKQYECENGLRIPISSTFIDSGGHFTQNVYQFVKPRHVRRIYAIKGMAGMGRAIIGKPNSRSKYRVLLFPIGVDTCKELIYARLNIDDFGPGYMHFNRKCDNDYFRELTAEKQVTKFNRGVATKVWTKIRTRNEALDCEVYALAAYTMLNPNIEKISEKIKIQKKIPVINSSPVTVIEKPKPFVKQNYLKNKFYNKQKTSWMKF